MLETRCGKTYFQGMDTVAGKSTRSNACLPLFAAALAGGIALFQAPAFAGCGGQVLTSYNESPVALAQRCGTTVQDLRMANPQLNMNRPLTGVQVDIPRAKKQYIPDAVNRGAPPASSLLGPVPHSHTPIKPMAYQPGNGMSYTIRRGDTLQAIADRNGVALESVIGANPGVDPRRLQVGERLIVPAID